ncbi:ndufa5, NADH-ubiquinone oxidoreductase subunit [Cyanidiococcus yangmingshanensis]|uniref:Ndufa5, NADH-ubiquinone oxidoreductase subunit n=1 Tax=Cyanidiococcus yangmingshanensis TaxID=2690220 RepID=A0A7J7IPX5_9RHOD|nr:ndufa5, NADH-ubiquinone oxidoreductase subunit [Cyanidiococcus yangmingshanensis]
MTAPLSFIRWAGLVGRSLSGLRPLEVRAVTSSTHLTGASVALTTPALCRHWSNRSEKGSAGGSARVYVSSGDIDWSQPYPVGYPVGLRPDPDAVGKLIAAYRQLLERVQTLAPESAYRRNVESLTRHRLDVTEANKTDRKALEESIGAGLVEELLAAAYDELDLIEQMEQWKPWEGQDNRTIPLHVID